MAVAAKAKDSYHSYGISGSSALDLDRLEREEQLQHAGEAPAYRPGTRTAARPVAETEVQVRQRQHVSPFTVLGMGVVLALSFMMITSYLRLTELSSETVKLQNELAALKVTNVALTAQHEQMFDLSSVKEAAEAAGMTKPGSSQICYIDLSGGDKAVIYREQNPGLLSGTLTSLRKGACAVVDFID